MKKSKNFRLSPAAIECLELLKNDERDNRNNTETAIVEMALFRFVTASFGHEKLNEIILGLATQDSKDN